MSNTLLNTLWEIQSAALVLTNLFHVVPESARSEWPADNRLRSYAHAASDFAEKLPENAPHRDALITWTTNAYEAIKKGRWNDAQSATEQFHGYAADAIQQILNAGWAEVEE